MGTFFKCRMTKIILIGILLLVFSSFTYENKELLEQSVNKREHNRMLKLMDQPVFTSLANQVIEQSVGNKNIAVEDTIEQGMAQTESLAPIDFLVLFVPSFSFDHLELLLDAMSDEMKAHFQIGAMTLRTAGGLNKEHNVITLATGLYERLISGWNAYQIEEGLRDDELTAGERYAQLSGQNPEAPIVIPSIFKWQKVWKENHEDQALPLWLGERLAAHGIYASALGNSDSLDIKKRMAPTLIINEKGVAQGHISTDIVQRDPLFPSGYRAKGELLQHELNNIWYLENSTFTVVEIGDIERLMLNKEAMEEGYYDSLEKVWFAEFGTWLEDVVNHYHTLGRVPEKNVFTNTVSNKSMLSANASTSKELVVWLISPWVSNEAMKEGQLLAPLLTWEQNQTFDILSSPTTKQMGIVSNLDFLPTVLNKYGIPTSVDIIGQIITSSSTMMLSQEQQQEIFEEWQAELDYMFKIYDKRRAVITSYLVVVIILLIISTLYWWFYRHHLGASLIQILIGAILLSPVFFLWLTPLIRVLDEYMWIVVLFCISLTISAIIRRLCSPSVFIGIICLANVGALLWDMLQGSLWMKRSFLGYDAIIGARFYGIGNEYAGILLGASIMAVTSFYAGWQKRVRQNGLDPLYHTEQKLGRNKNDRTRIDFAIENTTNDVSETSTKDSTKTTTKHITKSKPNHMQKRYIALILTSVGYGVILFLVGAPSFGTNFGATLAFLITFPVAQLLIFQFRLRVKQMLYVGIISVIGFLAFIFLQVQGEHTHINALIMTMKSGDLQTLFEIISRKWNMNLRLIKVSLWGKLFVVSLLVLLLYFFRARKEQPTRATQRMIWINGFRSIVLGAILLLLFNDSGVVAAATTMLFVTFPLLYQLLEKVIEHKDV